MSLTVGSRLGPYEILGSLGRGGMGEVFRARDTRLKRDVALKVLPDALVGDDDRVARFQREAELLATLTHQNVAAIYGIEESADTRALVMELVEGETLADRVAVGPVPVDEALPLARQIAAALDYAHEHGVLHRDLKPANIKVTPEGQVKVLDFGLAKAMAGQATGAVDLSVENSPTLTSPAFTQAGMLLGTAAYMSPEQVRGKTVDKRADIWAFGCVLYEMLTGSRAFKGETISDTLASVLRSEPDWSLLPAATPSWLRQLLERCLARETKERLRDIGDARFDQPLVVESPRASGHRSRLVERLIWTSAVALAVVGAAVVGMRSRPASPAPEVRLEITTPPTPDAASLAVSPDGRKIVFTTTGSDGRSQLELRSLDSATSRSLAGTDGAQTPFWSPDSQSIAFFADRKLKRLNPDGSIRVLADAGVGFSGDWNRDGVILFTTTNLQPIFRVPAGGGTSTQATRLVMPQRGHLSPRFLPDGRRFVYVATGSPEVQGVYLGELDRDEVVRLLDTDVQAVRVLPGHLLFARDGKLLAQPFDENGRQLSGPAFSIAENIAAAPAVSPAGVIAYRTGASGTTRQFVWRNRSGQEIGRLGEPDTGAPVNPSMSPTGQRIVMGRSVGGNTDIWTLDVARGVLDRFTSDPALDVFPVWTPDGTRVAFGSTRSSLPLDLYQAPAGGGKEELLLSTPQIKVPEDWSPNGRALIFRSLDPKMGFDLWVLPIDGDHKPFPFVRTEFDERSGQFSPDGRWVAYQSDESGRFEIYLRSFPDAGGKIRVSTAGGAQVRWRADGKELFYIALDGRLMAVEVRVGVGGSGLEVGTPVPLFPTRVGGAVQGVNGQQYMVSRDGQRFLLNTLTDEATSPVGIILNWRGKP